MAVHNTIEIMGPNYWMLIMGIMVLCNGATLLTLSIFNPPKKIISTVAMIIFSIMFMVLGSTGILFHNKPEHRIPTGETYIEAVFANGEIPAAYAKKYDVIDIYEGGVYLLQKKDGVKESRSNARIYEGEAE